MARPQNLEGFPDDLPALLAEAAGKPQPVDDNPSDSDSTPAADQPQDQSFLPMPVPVFEIDPIIERFNRNPADAYARAIHGKHSAGAPATPWNGPSIGSLSGDSKQRIQQVIAAARNIYPNNEVMVRLTVSQAILESGSHLDSGLAQKNNFFGIKGTGTGGTEEFSTTEMSNGQSMRIQAGFAINKTPEDSFLQHKALLEHDRYKGVQAAAAQGNFNGAAAAIYEAGYATDEDYAQKLIAINNGIVGPLMQQSAQANADANKDVTRAPHAPPRADLAVEASAATAPLGKKVDDGVHPASVTVAASSDSKSFGSRLARPVGLGPHA